MAKRKRINKLRLTIFIVLMLIIILLGAGCGMLMSLVRGLPNWKPSDLVSDATSFVYDYQGNYIGKLHETEDRIPIDYKDIPKNLENAFLATEDIGFYQHHGISIRGILRSAFVDITTGQKTQGASTITQQLVRTAILESRQKSFKRKIQEALLAIQVERKYTKQEILTFYLNEIYFGHGAYGVQAASQVYFGKSVKDLSLAECAILAGIVKSPRAYSPFLNEKNAYNRRQVVLGNMLKYNLIKQSQYDQANKEKFRLISLQERHHENYPWFMDYVVNQAENLLKERGFDTNDLYTGGLKIYTTLNPKIQSAAEEAFSKASNFPQSKTANLVEGAMVVLDTHSGAVRAIVGGREYLTKRGLNRANQPRQPGSTIKPIVDYAPALEEGYSPASVLDDIPVSFGSSSNPYSPQNDDGRFRGIISIRDALRESVNVPAVKMLNEIGVSTGYKSGIKMGLPLTDKDKHLAMALGGLDKGVTPLQMASAYTSFANSGKRCNPTAIIKITDRKGNILVDGIVKTENVISPETAYLITDMLRTVVNAGTGIRAQISGRPVAGKTGTTQLPESVPEFKNIRGNKDSWFCGYTPELVGVVWEGYDSNKDKNGKPQYLYKAYGGNFPAKIFHDVLQVALRDVPVKPFNKPSDIVYMAVDAKSGLLPSQYTPSKFIVNEIFAKQNVPNKVSDIWVPAVIDPETHQLATTACPQRISGIFMKRKEHWYNRAPEDANLELPYKYCQLHPGSPATSANHAPQTPPANPGGGNTTPIEQTPPPQQPGGGETAPPTSGDKINGNSNDSVNNTTY